MSEVDDWSEMLDESDTDWRRVTCDECGGKGRAVEGWPCEYCDGEGHIDV